MITWRIERGGQTLSEWGHFDSFLQQAYLLPILDVGAGTIDEYGSWTYVDDDLLRLRQIIANWLPGFELYTGQQLQVTTLSEGAGYLDVDSIIKLLEILDAMAAKAIAEDAGIKFYGD